MILSPFGISVVSDSLTTSSAAPAEIGGKKGTASLIVGSEGFANGTIVGIRTSGVEATGSIVGDKEAGIFEGFISEEGHDSLQMLLMLLK
jgi:hypothetical protein